MRVPPTQTERTQSSQQPAGGPTATKPPVKTDGGGNSSIAPHPDAPKTKSESNCIVRFFVSMKNQIARFFNWVCSLFSSGSKKPTEEEKKAMEDKKQQAEAEAKLKEALADPNLLPQVREVLQTMLDLVKVNSEIDDLDKAIKARYKDPVATDEKAMLYLFDMTQMAEPMKTLKEVVRMEQLDPARGMAVLANMPVAVKHINEYLAKHKTLREPNKEEHATVIEMIKQLKDQGPLVLVKDLPIHKDLLKFVNKVRKEHQLPPVSESDNGKMSEFMTDDQKTQVELAMTKQGLIIPWREEVALM